MTVLEMSWRMTRSELLDWIAFFEVEPWGTQVEDYRTTILANASGVDASQEKLFPWTREVYDDAVSKERKAAADLRKMEAAIESYFAAHNERLDLPSA